MTDTDQPINEAPAPASKSVTLQRPLIIGLLYIANIMLGFSVFVGLVLAYVWRAEESTPEWEKTHYTYLIRTFWKSVILGVIGMVLWIAGFASMAAQGSGQPGAPFFILMFGVFIGALAMFVWFCVRSILSLIKAGEQKPMPNPETWLW